MPSATAVAELLLVDARRRPGRRAGRAGSPTGEEVADLGHELDDAPGPRSRASTQTLGVEGEDDPRGLPLHDDPVGPAVSSESAACSPPSGVNGRGYIASMTTRVSAATVVITVPGRKASPIRCTR